MNHPHIKFFLVLIAMAIGTSMNAQVSKSTFKGKVIDESDLPIPGATVMILDRADSTLIQFGSSDKQGMFAIKNVAQGDYLLNINFLAHAPLYRNITAGTSEEVDLGTLKLEPENTILSEVEVKADHVPIEITKDTISYNADAFETQPNADVEELLKKLPGIEVGQDGSIKAQGEEVTRVFVDGKEFFGDDPKMATKNLPAKGVKKVKVYDKQSEMAEFTGVDDGIREKTIDLQMKDEFKKGLFGTAQAGYGSDERYNAKAAINRFTKTNQVSFLGQFNNINDQGFSFNDRMNFSGGMRGMGGGGGGRSMEFRSSGSDVPFNTGNNTGLINTGAAGLNFNFQQNKNFNIRSSYFFNNVNKELDQFSFRQTFSDDPFDTEETANRDSENQSHSFALNSDIQIDSFSQLQLTTRASFGNATGLGESFLQNIVLGAVENQSTTTEDNKVDNSSFSGTGTYMHKFGKTGRNFSVSGTYSKNENDTDSDLEALTEYFNTGNEEALRQLQFANSDDRRLEGQFSYTEPLKKRRFLEFNYNYSKQNSDYLKRVTDITDTSSQENPLLSTDYNSIFQYHRPGATFRYSGEVHNVNIGLNYQLSELTGRVDQGENAIERNYNHFLPRASWRWDIGNGKHLRVNYNTRVNSPSITQLSPVIDNSDPLRLYVGNPNLDAEFNHSLGMNFHSFSQFSMTSFFASINGGVTENKIITSRTIDEEFRETSSPINIDQEKTARMYASFGRPFKLIHSRFNINTNMSYTNTQSSVDAKLLDVNRWTRGFGFSISNLNSKVLEYNFGADWTFTDNYYKSDADLDQNTLLTTYFADATLTMWKKWKITGGYDYNLYSSSQFGDDQSLPLLEFSISRLVLPGDKGQIKLSVFDVLDENRGLSRSADINYIEEVRSNSIGRYAMLSFIYSIRGFNQEGGPGGGGMFKVIERRH